MKEFGVRSVADVTRDALRRGLVEMGACTCPCQDSHASMSAMVGELEAINCDDLEVARSRFVRHRRCEAQSATLPASVYSSPG